MLRFCSSGPIKEGNFYVERPVDKELVDLLLQGELVYVLAPRQIGKSSLRLRSAQQLHGMGVHCAAIGLDELGTTVTEEQWYFGLIRQLVDALHLSGDPEELWAKYQGSTSPVQRWSLFLREQVIEKIHQPVVIFIDEIETTGSLRFGNDDFFLSIRAAFNLRATQPTYRRLTFCLLGLTLPSDLISDETRSPFNIGKAIRLEDFSRAQAKAFAPGLRETTDDPECMLDAIHDWTEGHPYMSQLLCEKLSQQALPERARPIPARVQTAVEQCFLDRGVGFDGLDINLACAERYFDKAKASPRTFKMLRLYEKLLVSEAPVEAKGLDSIQMALRLTGMVAERKEGSKTVLRVRNRIFATVFEKNWVRARQADRLITESMQRWLENDRREEFVLRGKALQQAYEWSQGREDVTADERQYLLVGMEAAGREEVAQKQREGAAERARARRQMFVVLIVTTLPLLFALLAAAAQYLQIHAADLAQRGQRAALLATMPGKEIEALRLALRGVPEQARRSPEVANGLVAAASRVVRFTLLPGHRAGVRTAAFSADGRYIATGAKDHIVRVWDGQTGTLLWQKEGHPGVIHSVAFSKDSKYLVTGGDEGTACIWNVQNGEEVRKFLPPPALVAKQSRLVGSGECRAHIGVASVAFSPDGTSILTASWDNAARLWDVASGRLLQELKEPNSHLEATAFSPDGTQIIIGSAYGDLRIWNIRTQEPRDLPVYSNEVLSVDFSPDGQLVATAGLDKMARVWDAHNGRLLFALSGHSDRVLSVSFSKDGRYIATGSADQTARVWDLQSGTVRVSLEGHQGWVRTAVFSPDGRRLITASDDHTVRMWDLHQGRAFMELEGRTQWILTAAFAPDNRVVTGNMDGTAQIWDARSGETLVTLAGKGAWVSAAVFSSDGHYVITGDGDGTVRKWDALSGRLVQSLHLQNGRVAAVAASSDGRLFAAASSDDPVVHIFDADSFSERSTLRGHEIPTANSVLTSVAFSPTGDRIITGGGDRTVRLWETRSGKPLKVLRGHDGAVFAVAFSPSGELIVSGGVDHTARVWNSRTGKLMQILTGHERAVSAVAFSPNEKHIVTTSWDGAAHIFEASSGTLLWGFALHNGPIYAVSFSSDGQRMVLAGAAKRALIIPATLQGFIDYAQGFLGDQSIAEKETEKQPVTLGGINLNEGCRIAEGDGAHAVLTKPVYSPGAAYAWQCKLASGRECNMDLDPYCQWLYKDPHAVAAFTEFDNAHTWYCLKP